MSIDQEQATKPYGVDVGDRVYYWLENPPPLSSTYVKPECLSALVLGGFTWDDATGWHADLLVVEPDGHGGSTIRLLHGIRQAEGGAWSYGNPNVNYGISPGGSWHRDIVHAKEVG